MKMMKWMDDWFTRPPSRKEVGAVLLLAAVLCVAAAAMLRLLGMTSPSSVSWSFLGTVLFLKLGFFSFWPVLVSKGKQASTSLKSLFGDEDDPLFEDNDLGDGDISESAQDKRGGILRLWDQKDPRLDVSLFSANVPSFVLSQDDYFLDWNVAFELIFGQSKVVRRGVHVAQWFKLLDNFRNVSKRSAKLFGEGILPITDRERVSFVHDQFGRMVFTKIMTPVVDRMTGKILGWSVVLNINSVNRRQEFFEELFKRIHEQSRHARYVASFHGLFGSFSAFRDLKVAHLQAMEGAARVLDVGCGTGELSLGLLRDGHRVAAVDGDVDALRQLKMRSEPFWDRLRIVKRSVETLGKLPERRYDGATLMLGMHHFENPVEVLKHIASSLKSGAVIALSAYRPGADGTLIMNSLRTELESNGKFENLKHQFQHSATYEKERISAAAPRLYSVEEIKKILRESGFHEILKVRSDMMVDQGIFIVARRR